MSDLDLDEYLSIEEEIEEIEENDENEEIIQQNSSKSISACYEEYLKDNNLLLTPEYQRDFCWSIEKQNALLDTIYKNWIMPNYVIYKLSKSESKDSEYCYECIDGQHRFKTIKYFIENTNNNIYIKIDKFKVFYSSSDSNKLLLEKKKKYRIFTKDEKNNFNDYQMFINIIQSKNNKSLNIGTKCQIFNRLQNGEKVASYIKVKNNNNNIITSYIRTNKLLDYMNDLQLIDKLLIKKMIKYENFTIYFCIRTFLIIDKKNLDINYLDLNIKKYLFSNNGVGSPQVQIHNNIDEILIKVKEIINFICTNEKINNILPELAYIYICIYANFGLNSLNKIIDYLFLNKNIFDKYNDIKKYQKSSVTSVDNIKKQYDSFILSTNKLID
jgi:hypothetical protein